MFMKCTSMLIIEFTIIQWIARDFIAICVGFWGFKTHINGHRTFFLRNFAYMFGRKLLSDEEKLILENLIRLGICANDQYHSSYTKSWSSSTLGYSYWRLNGQTYPRHRRFMECRKFMLRNNNKACCSNR